MRHFKTVEVSHQSEEREVILFPDETADALYAGVLDHPQDDLRRLILADRLRENGKDRYADFIQNQISGTLASLPLTLYGPLCDDLFPGRTRRASNFSTGESYVDAGDVRLTWRKGFVSEVRAPLAWLLGGLCDYCDGTGEYDDGFQLSRRHCFSCDGTGRTPGHLAGLVRKWPIEVVIVVSDDGSTTRRDDLLEQVKSTQEVRHP